ncbi:hypothetical protein AB0D12_23465 [Streptomyces sp. NPDC048479]|uniref:hypothetical protein n=1 Tax=Streptomyces sp. NPDC048479 TaxID=3154725 RepID=UPI00343B8ADC
MVIEAHRLDELDTHRNPMGCKGIGQICIVGTAAAITKAVPTTPPASASAKSR